MLNSAILALAAAVTTPTTPPPVDPRATGAALVFYEMCVGAMLDEKAALDPANFSVTRLDEATRREIKPDSRADALFDVSSDAVNLHMLVRTEPSGTCFAEVAEADEPAMRAAFQNLIAKLPALLKSTPSRDPDIHKAIEGKNATISNWRFPVANSGTVALGLTTYPDARFMIQHVMTVGLAP